jgi:GntR family transcriptional repressor for pyruvate dehydrogenase complex
VDDVVGELNLTCIPKKEKVTDLVLDQIKDSLLRGELKPGDRLPGSSELAKKMGVGISSVREALKMLQSLGAVESRQGEGTFVCSTLREGAASAFEIQLMLLPQTAEYLTQFREMYETAFTQLAMDMAAEADLKRVEASVTDLEKKVAQSSSNASVSDEDELEFHRAVLYCTHNPYVIKIGEVALELFFNALQSKTAPLNISDAAADHRAIYEALRDKDPEKLRQVFKKCFPIWHDRLRPRRADAELSVD